MEVCTVTLKKSLCAPSTIYCFRKFFQSLFWLTQEKKKWLQKQFIFSNISLHNTYLLYLVFLTLNTKTFKFRKLPVCIPYDVHRSHLGGDRSEDIQRCTFSSTFFHLEASNIETYLPLQVKDLYIISVLYITESSKRDSYLPILVVAMRSNFHSRKGKPDASSPFYSHADSLPRHHC